MVNAAGGIVIAVVAIAVIGIIAWVAFTQIRARRLGLPPPPFKSYIPFMNSDPYSSRPSGGGVGGWFRSLRRSRTGDSAYEQPLHGGQSPAVGRRGFGPLDPDEAWDSRVGHEADTYGPYGGYDDAGPAQGGGRGGGPAADRYEMNVPSAGGFEDESRGRSGPAAGRNPFDDEAEASNISLRGVSPRPMEGGGASAGPAGGSHARDGSPTSRKSVFREEV